MAVDVSIELFQSTRPVKGATRVFRRDRGRCRFQSTRPVKGATRGALAFPYGRRVSIHAPREGRDQAMLKDLLSTLEFQSTRPVKGATIAR